MKKVLLMILICSGFIHLFAQKGDRDGNYFLLPKDSGTISLNSYNEKGLEELATYDINQNSLYATDGVRYTAIFDTQRLNLLLYDSLNDSSLKIGSPFDISAKSILVYQNSVFIGGFREGTFIIQFNKDEMSWSTLAIPDEPQFLNRKAIDDLVIHRNILVAVDNIVSPKYNLYYKLDGNNTEYSHYKQLAVNSSYEGIKFARMNDKYFGTLSTSMNHGLRANHITVYPIDYMGRCISITGITGHRRFEDDREKETTHYKDFVFVGDNIVVLSLEKGLGILKIEKGYFTNLPKFAGRRDLGDLVELGVFNINLMENETITELRAIPQTNKVIAIINDERGILKYEIIDIEI